MGGIGGDYWLHEEKVFVFIFAHKNTRILHSCCLVVGSIGLWVDIFDAINSCLVATILSGAALRARVGCAVGTVSIVRRLMSVFAIGKFNYYFCLVTVLALHTRAFMRKPHNSIIANINTSTCLACLARILAEINSMHR